MHGRAYSATRTCTFNVPARDIGRDCNRIAIRDCVCLSDCARECDVAPLRHASATHLHAAPDRHAHTNTHCRTQPNAGDGGVGINRLHFARRAGTARTALCALVRPILLYLAHASEISREQ